MRANPHEGPMSDEMVDLRAELFAAFLSNVPFDGWSPAALRAACTSLGKPAVTGMQAFPGGMVELAEYWSETADAEMVDVLESMNLSELRVRDRIATGVQVRIDTVAAHKEAVRSFSSFVALPPNAPMVPRMAWKTCDAIWRAAGDTSTDHNHYTKRGLLLPVYTSTVLYWLADDGDETGDWPKTWEYLDRRIDNVIQVFGRLGKAGKAFQRFIPGPLAPAFAPRAPKSA